MLSKPAWAVVGLGLFSLMAGVCYFALSGSHATVDSSGSRPSTPATESTALPRGTEIRFENVTAAAGINFLHVDGATDTNYVMETMGPGAGWIDYDQDGLLDLVLVQGSSLFGPHPANAPTTKLYRNCGGGRFCDVTAETGTGIVGYGMGVAVGDIDNDGYPEIFLAYFNRPNALLKNVPDGKGGRKFLDITAQAGMATHPDWSTRPNFSTSAAFLDFDNDGYLDLFVCSYILIDLKNYPECKTDAGFLISCAPRLFRGTRCHLYRNNRNGTFSEIGKEIGIDKAEAKALGVVAADLDDDGFIDLFVANDTVPNFLYRNIQGKRFEEVGVASGCAVNLDGQPQAYMGVDVDDLNGDGLPDLFVTAFSQEFNSLFRNQGKAQFLDVTDLTGMGQSSWWKLGFGTVFMDLDLDGQLDIVVVNGHVARRVEEEGNPNLRFKQEALVYLNLGNERFRDITSAVGGYFMERHVGRALALGDFDNDGLADLVVSNSSEPTFLLRNVSQTPNQWVRLTLQGTKSNRDAVGARVTLRLSDGRTIVRHRKGGGSYLSALDPRLLIGVGKAQSIEQVEVRWPNGGVQTFGPLAVRKHYRLVEGDNKPHTVPNP